MKLIRVDFPNNLDRYRVSENSKSTYSSIACHEADLAESKFEANVLNSLGISHVGLMVPPSIARIIA
jgi:hypothetical protein